MQLTFGEQRVCRVCKGTGTLRGMTCANCEGTKIEGGKRAVGLAEGRARRDEAVSRVEQHTSASWRKSAEAAAAQVAVEQPELTTDDVWEVLKREGVEGPHEPRAMGPVMLALARQNVIVATPHFTTTARPVAHAAPIRIWRSLVYRP